MTKIIVLRPTSSVITAIPEKESAVKCHIVDMQQLGSVWEDNVAEETVEHGQLANRSIWQPQLRRRFGPAILLSDGTVHVIDLVEVVIRHPVIDTSLSARYCHQRGKSDTKQYCLPWQLR